MLPREHVCDGRERSHGVGIEGEVGPPPALLPLDEAGVEQLLQVVRDRWLREPDPELADADVLGAGEPVDDRDAGRVGQRLEVCGQPLGVVARKRRCPRRAARLVENFELRLH